MFTSKKFKGVTNITRKGAVNKVVIPDGLLNSIGMDFEINGDTINFIDGNEVFVMTEKFGVSEETSITLFLIDGGFIVNVIYGKIYLEDTDNGVVYSVDENGDVEYAKSNQIIHWVSVKDFMGYAERMVKSYYNTPNYKKTVEYINNLGFGIDMRLLKGDGSPCFSMKFVTYYHDLGGDNFIFIKYDDEEKESQGVSFVDISECIPIDEDEDEIVVDSEGYDDDENLVSLEDLESDYDDDYENDYE